MSGTTDNQWTECGHLKACPHCGIGEDGVTLGPYWDFNEECWRCIICGYRAYEEALCYKSKAEIMADKLWDEVLDALDKEENSQTAHYDSDRESMQTHSDTV